MIREIGGDVIYGLWFCSGKHENLDIARSKSLYTGTTDQMTERIVKLTILSDNNTFIGPLLFGEPGLSFFIEDAGTKILFDTGYSDLFLRNAQTLGLHPEDADVVVLSHGHYDHTCGLPYLLPHLHKTTRIVTHPDTFAEKMMEDGKPLGSPVREEEVRERGTLQLSRSPVRISKNIQYLGEIPQTTEFETRTAMAVRRLADGTLVPDYVREDSGLVYTTDAGICIITGCSHSGICNMIEYAREITGESRVLGIIGGFHLRQLTPATYKTITYLRDLHPAELYPCHCVSFPVRAALHQEIPIGETGVGFTVEW